MANLSKVMLPDGNTYDFIDTNLRNFGSEEPIVMGHDGKGGTVYRKRVREQINITSENQGDNVVAYGIGFQASSNPNDTYDILHVYGDVKVLYNPENDDIISNDSSFEVIPIGSEDAQDNTLYGICYNASCRRMNEAPSIAIHFSVTSERDVYALMPRACIFDVYVEYLVHNSEDEEFELILNPADAVAKSGNIYFKVYARNAASYQWQVSTNNGSTWTNSGMGGNKTSRLTVAATSSRNGYLFRCNITDKNGVVTASKSAKFTYA